MTQEIQVTITLEVDATLQKADIEDMLMQSGLEIIKVDSIKEEAEIYETEKQYPFNEGDDYWVIEDNKPILSTWDCISEQMHDDNPNRIYYQSEEDAHEALLNKS